MQIQELIEEVQGVVDVGQTCIQSLAVFEGNIRTAGELICTLTGVLDKAKEIQTGNLTGHREIRADASSIKGIEEVAQSPEKISKITKLQKELIRVMNTVITPADIQGYHITPESVVAIHYSGGDLGKCIEVHENGTIRYCCNDEKVEKDSRDHVLQYLSVLGRPIQPSDDVLKKYKPEIEDLKEKSFNAGMNLAFKVFGRAKKTG